MNTCFVYAESRIAALEMAAASRPSDLLQAERRFGDELQRQQLTAQAKHSELEVQQTDYIQHIALPVCYHERM
jgi:hypothetical protein